MRLGLRAFLKQKLRPKSKYFAIGIAIHEDAVTFCLLDKDKSDTVSLIQEKVVSIHNWDEQLASWTSQNELAGTPTFVAFAIYWYQQLQLDKPAVEDNEIASALTWSVNELLGG